MSRTGDVRRTEGRFTGAGGRSLFTRSWLPVDGASRVMVVVHGFGEHCGRYDALGAFFASRGTAVHAYDQRGHGESAGDRQGHLERFSDFLDDLEGFVASARAPDASLPCTLLGHSMGGLVAAAFARERSGRIDFLVTSGALLGLPPDMSPLKIRAARLLRRLAPRLRMAGGVQPEALSRDPEVGRRYVEDPLVFTSMTTSLGAELLAAIQRTAGAGQTVRVPVLMLHGGDDWLAPPSGSQRFYESLVEADRHGSEFRVLPGLRHEIFNEPEGGQLFADVDAWLAAREGERAEAGHASASGGSATARDEAAPSAPPSWREEAR